MSNNAASLLVAWQLNQKFVLIVGGGEVASGRLQSVLTAGATVRLIAPSNDTLHPLIKQLITEHPQRIIYHDRDFVESDLTKDLNMVLTAIDDVETSRHIANLCRDKHIPINAADIPPSCDFYFGSQIRRGPLQIMVSTNGKGPKLANIIRRRLEATLPDQIEEAIENVGALRVKLRSRAPGVGGELSQKRMEWMSKVCTAWDLEELAQLDDALADKLLDEGWELQRVPSYISIAADHRHSQTRTTFPYISSPPSWFLPFLIGAAIGMSSVLVYSRRR